MSTLGAFLHDVADALQFDGPFPPACLDDLRRLADDVEQDAPTHPSPAWQAFELHLAGERDEATDPRRREMLSRLLGSVRKLMP